MKGIECIELRKFITEYKQKNEKMNLNLLRLENMV